MTLTIERRTALPFTTQPRMFTPRLWLIHATRGAGTQASQAGSTIDWFTRSAPDGGGWGPTADVLIDHEGKVFEFRDIPRERGQFSAGYGQAGPPAEVAADEYSISIELAQSAAQEPFAAATIDALVAYVRQRSADWGLEIPAVRVASWSQRADELVPAGWIGHEDTAHGRKTGKSDPGAQFPWAEVLARVAAPVAAAAPARMTSSEAGRVWANQVVGAYADRVEVEAVTPRRPGARAFRVEFIP